MNRMKFTKPGEPNRVYILNLPREKITGLNQRRGTVPTHQELIEAQLRRGLIPSGKRQSLTVGQREALKGAA